METEMLLHSFSAQVSCYNDLIQKDPDWEFAGICADESISAMDTRKRDGFNQMIAAAMDQGEYQRRHNELIVRYEVARDGYEKASGDISDRQRKWKVYMRFINGSQRSNGFCNGFEEELWTALLDHATVTPRTTSVSLLKMDLRVTFEFVFATKGR